MMEQIYEIIHALAAFGKRSGREVELILRPDHTLELMGVCDNHNGGYDPNGFELIERFDSVEDLFTFLGVEG